MLRADIPHRNPPQGPCDANLLLFQYAIAVLREYSVEEWLSDPYCPYRLGHRGCFGQSLRPRNDSGEYWVSVSTGENPAGVAANPMLFVIHNEMDSRRLGLYNEF